MSKKVLLLLLLIAVAAGCGVWYWWSVNGAKELRFPGIVEIQEVRLGSKIGGRVFAAPAKDKEGMEVYPGQELVIFEAPELEAQRDQLKARLDAAAAELDRANNGPRAEEKKAAQSAADAAKARYDRMVEGWREEEKRQAASELETAQAELKQTTDDFLRVSELYRQKSVARAEYDAALAARDRAQGKFNSARAKVDMVKSGNRKEDVAEAKAEWERAAAKAEELYNGTRAEDKALARAKVAEARAKLQEVEVQLQEAVVRVPKNLGKAIVEVVAVRPGDIVPPNQPVVRVLKAEDLWIKVFVPETQLGLIPLNTEAEVRVKIDSFPGKWFKGRVKQKATISEFTPRNVQSVDERRYQMFALKIQVEDPGNHFNAGMAAEVRIPLE
ncbi:MAG: HlyD family efflux transporter periplasmic adaptor subunit [Gemmataceae bacterium]|nr:HlyD family efflux transporter periplasmic adaptor subunit [Gemmataceae bacterium]